MTTETRVFEKRRHTRYKVNGGGFALLRCKDTDEVLGAISDISAGGLCLSHIDDHIDIDRKDSLTINLISSKYLCGQISGRSVWSQKEEADFAAAMIKMKRCGIRFEQLDSKLKGQLTQFIDSLMKE